MSTTSRHDDLLALLVGERLRDDRALHSQLLKAGFRVDLVSAKSLDQPPGGDSVAPALLIVDADAVASISGFPAHSDGAAEIIVIGDGYQQPELSSHFANGDALFLRRPLDFDYLSDLLNDVQDEQLRRGKAQHGRTPDVSLDQFGLLYGSSSGMKRLFRILRKASASDATLCVSGESGTGKELVAQSVHAYSDRSKYRFDGINCGALPSELIESELFGHERGSFSGAHRTHRGLFERVGQGTLLLDEITEMPESAQVTLLRVLETGQFRRVGAEEDMPCRARIIAATNRSPEEALEQGKLREDLYYRISQMSVSIPPLRERGEDVIELTRLFVKEFSEQSGQAYEVADEAYEWIRGFSWPGNVRQLRNVVFSACRVCAGRIELEHLPTEDWGDTSGASGAASGTLRIAPGTPLAEVERRVILATLEACDDEKALAAEQLGISVRTLYNRLKEYGNSGDN
ncbi:MAG: sigma-54 dependent transcriptional regulator [Halieaceae bacterium]|jgi:DNA-binding NtrC family response regulator|nr:sigma-54 dependent transcriptional regulator [Halieaceae bacterium]